MLETKPAPSEIKGSGWYEITFNLEKAQEQHLNVLRI